MEADLKIGMWALSWIVIWKKQEHLKDNALTIYQRSIETRRKLGQNIEIPNRAEIQLQISTFSFNHFYHINYDLRFRAMNLILLK